MNYYTISPLVNCISSVVLGCIVLIRNPRKEINWTFSLFAFSIALWSLSYFFWQISSSESAALFWSKSLMVFAIPLAPFYLHFVLVFLGIKKRHLLTIIYAPFIVFVIVNILTPYFITGVRSVLTFKFWPIPGLFYHYYLIFWMGGMISSICLLYRAHRVAKGLLKIQIKYLLLGIFTAVVGGSTNYFLWYDILIPPYGNVLVAVYVALTAYIIIKHRFLDIRLVVARVTAYTLLIIFLAIAYSGGLFIIGSVLFPQAAVGGRQLVTSTFLALFLAFTFQPLRRFLENTTDKIFFKAKYDPQKLLGDLSRMMASTLSLSDLTEDILRKLNSNLKIRKSFFVLTRESSILWIKGEGQGEHPEFDETKICYLVEVVAKKPSENILVFDEMYESEEKNIMRSHNLNLVLPLVVKDEIIGAILLTEKISGDIYSVDDVNVLKILIPEVAVAVKNALSYEEIKRFNITLEEEIKLATKKLEEANLKLKELDQLKSEFVSIASHELRTPMTAIKSYLWMVLNKSTQPLDPKLKDYVKIAYNSTERLINLVKDMLTISRIEGNRYELHMEKCNLYELLKQIYDELIIAANEKKINLILNQPKEDLFVNADREKIREVFINIIGNSLKFTPENGSITISFAERDSILRVSISDTGPGISQEDIPKLFQKFNRLDHSYTQTHNITGTGLGLYISKQIITLHNGDIGVESELGKGSVFTISIPELYSGKTNYGSNTAIPK